MTLLIRRSKIHSDGCFTTGPIKKGARIVEYTGRRLTIAEADALYEKSERTYLFGLDSGTHVLDGDGIAAFINHSCSPNCEPDEIKGRVYVIARRNIKAGEELCYDYNLYDGGPNDKAPCYCGAKNCRGTMYSREELVKRAREERKKAKAEKNGKKG